MTVMLRHRLVVQQNAARVSAVCLGETALWVALSAVLRLAIAVSITKLASPNLPSSADHEPYQPGVQERVAWLVSELPSRKSTFPISNNDQWMSDRCLLLPTRPPKTTPDAANTQTLQAHGPPGSQCLYREECTVKPAPDTEAASGKRSSQRRS